jgi:multicomponent Na+:H+ antiporter subunit B
MTSLILRTTTKFLTALLLMFSLFLLLRGHNDAGGGFVGGLVASIAIILFAWANTVAEARRLIRVDPRGIIGVGLLTALSSTIAAFLNGEPFLTGHVWAVDFLGVTSLKLSTALIFDTGVFLTVFGVTLTIILSLAED